MGSRVERHLCVIFAADVAGYSTLMRRDEEGTLAQLITARQKMDELVAAHRGRIVNSVGDSVLAEFASVMDAIQAAIAIQRDLDAAATTVDLDKRVRFRIGLQLGEVMVRSTDIYGDGVNVAARLQTLADPGGIVVSGTVYDQLRDRLAIPFVDLGQQTVKNIERPVPAFGLTWDAIAALPEASSLAKTLESRKLYEAALRLDPNHVQALHRLANSGDALIDIDPQPDRDRIVAEMDGLSIRALQLDGTDPWVWRTRMVALADLGRWGAAIEAIDQAIRLDPYSPGHPSDKAWLMNMTARPAEALTLVDQALALKPANAGWEVRVQCESYLLLGQADRAVQSCEKASGLDPSDWIVQLFLVAAYANHGDMAKAADAKRSVLKAVPDYTIAVLRAKRYSEVPEYLKLAETYWYDGLRKAGVPEK